MDRPSLFVSQYKSYVYITSCTVDADETKWSHMGNRKIVQPEWYYKTVTICSFCWRAYKVVAVDR